MWIGAQKSSTNGDVAELDAEVGIVFS
jgi:hypothetical protein